MIPIKFKESNKVLVAPKNWDVSEYGECGDLYTYNDGHQSISLWRLTWKERFQILFNGKIWLGIMSGKSQPAVWLDSQKTVFKDEN
jgi:hypothetical protein